MAPQRQYGSSCQHKTSRPEWDAMNLPKAPLDGFISDPLFKSVNALVGKYSQLAACHFEFGSASASILRSAFDRAFSHRHLIHWSLEFQISGWGTRLLDGNMCLRNPDDNSGYCSAMMTSHAWPLSFSALKFYFSSPRYSLASFQ